MNSTEQTHAARDALAPLEQAYIAEYLGAHGHTAETLPPEAIVAHCITRLAAVKVPRFIEYRAAPLPRSTSGKVRKPDLVAERSDLRQGSWDRSVGRWA